MNTRKLEELYNTDLDAYVAMLTKDWTQYDWDMFKKAINDPVWDDWNDTLESSYYNKYIKNS